VVVYRLSWYQRAAVNRGVTSVSAPHRRDVIASASDDGTSHVTLSRAVHRSRPASPPECTSGSRGLFTYCVRLLALELLNSSFARTIALAALIMVAGNLCVHWLFSTSYTSSLQNITIIRITISPVVHINCN